MQGYDSAVGSSATYSSPVQNTPTSISSSVADVGMFSSPPSWASTPPTSPDSTHTSVNYIPDDASKRPQRVSFSSQEPPKSKQNHPDTTHHKSVSSSAYEQARTQEREPKFTPSISSIGNAVLKSRTADFERIITVDSPPSRPRTSSENKKYTKRRYTDSRHQTRHIPDSDALDASGSQKKDERAAATQIYKRRELISSVPSK